MCGHINSVCRSASLELRGTGSVRPFRPCRRGRCWICSLAWHYSLSRIDGCNSLMAGWHYLSTDMPDVRTDKPCCPTDRQIRTPIGTTPLASGLLQYSSFNWQLFHSGTLMAPYLFHCLSYSPTRSLRSSFQKLLTLPRVNLKSTDARHFPDNGTNIPTSANTSDFYAGMLHWTIINWLSCYAGLHLFGIRCHWTPASSRLCPLLSLNSKHLFLTALPWTSGFLWAAL